MNSRLAALRTAGRFRPGNDGSTRRSARRSSRPIRSINFRDNCEALRLHDRAISVKTLKGHPALRTFIANQWPAILLRRIEPIARRKLPQPAGRRGSIGATTTACCSGLAYLQHRHHVTRFELRLAISAHYRGRARMTVAEPVTNLEAQTLPTVMKKRSPNSCIRLFKGRFAATKYSILSSISAGLSTTIRLAFARIIPDRESRLDF